MMAEQEFPPQRALAGRGVYVLDDHEVVRRGLRHLLESDALSIAGESGSAREALRRIPALRPDLVILDDDLPDGSGAEVCRALAAADPGIRCVLMTGEADEAVLIDCHPGRRVGVPVQAGRQQRTAPAHPPRPGRAHRVQRPVPARAPGPVSPARAATPG